MTGYDKDQGEWIYTGSTSGCCSDEDHAPDDSELLAMERCVTLCRGRHRANMEFLRRKKFSSLARERKIIRFPRRYSRKR